MYTFMYSSVGIIVICTVHMYSSVGIIVICTVHMYSSVGIICGIICNVLWYCIVQLV